MRKKLLALLMCATMVLGTGVTAFAASPVQDDFDDAETILKKGDKVVSEWNASTYKKTGYVPGEGSTTYAFLSADVAGVGVAGQAVKLNDDGDVLAYIGAVDYDVTSYDTTTYANPSAALAALIASKSTDNTVDAGRRIATIVSQSTNMGTVKSAAVYTVTNGFEYDSTKAISANLTTDNSEVKHYSLSDGEYKTADGYSFDVVSTTNTDLTDDDANTNKEIKDGYLLKAAAKAKDANGNTFLYTLTDVADTYGLETYKLDVAEALANDTISADAVAVALNAYQVTKNGDVNNNAHPFVYGSVTAPASEVTMTFDTDILSRAKLLNGSVDVYRISDQKDYDTEYGQYYNLLASVASGVETGNTFTSKFTTSFAEAIPTILIFDNAKDAGTSDNDGVNDNTTATTAASQKTTSEKTGDVAPIAALAVVMMGACGAMVVASKKRA